MLSGEDRRTLLDLARLAVGAAARGERPPRLENPPPALQDKGAAFVTLRAGDELRGCVGHIAAVRPLWESVRDMAGAAAVSDSRFSPVRPEEAAALRIEISILSPMRPIKPEDVVVGTHGLYVKRGFQSGLLLPQVPVEWNWTREEFLRQVNVKAGLQADAKDVELLAFTAEKFGP